MFVSYLIKKVCLVLFTGGIALLGSLLVFDKGFRGLVFALNTNKEEYLDKEGKEEGKGLGVMVDSAQRIRYRPKLITEDGRVNYLCQYVKGNKEYIDHSCRLYKPTREGDKVLVNDLVEEGEGWVLVVDRAFYQKLYRKNVGIFLLNKKNRERLVCLRVIKDV